MNSRRFSTSGGVVAAADRVLKTEDEHKARIKELHAQTCHLGQQLAHGGGIEATIRSVCNNEEDASSMDECERFLQVQRKKIKELTQKHVDSIRDIDAFMAALRQVKSDIVNGRHQQAGASDDGDNHLPTNYESILQSQIEKQQSQLKSGYLDYADTEFMRTISDRLGETQHKKSGAGGNDEDDDIEEITNEDSSAGFKCPIKQVLMEEPMRNKLCGHTYSREGIIFYLRTKRKCPVPGCRNDVVTMEQLELDTELAIKIRRFQKRQENEKRLRLTQEEENAVDVDEEDEDEPHETYID